MRIPTILMLAAFALLVASFALAKDHGQKYAKEDVLGPSLVNWPLAVPDDRVDTMIVNVRADSVWGPVVRGTRNSYLRIENWNQAEGWLTTEWRKSLPPDKDFDATYRSKKAIEGGDPDPDAAKIHDDFCGPGADRMYFVEIANRIAVNAEPIDSVQTRILVRRQVVGAVAGDTPVVHLQSRGRATWLVREEIAIELGINYLGDPSFTPPR